MSYIRVSQATHVEMSCHDGAGFPTKMARSTILFHAEDNWMYCVMYGTQTTYLPLDRDDPNSEMIPQETCIPFHDASPNAATAEELDAYVERCAELIDAELSEWEDVSICTQLCYPGLDVYSFLLSRCEFKYDADAEETLGMFIATRLRSTFERLHEDCRKLSKVPDVKTPSFRLGM